MKRGWLVGIVCAGAAALATAAIAGRVGAGVSEEELALLRQQVRRAAVACYASEGRYPQSLDYLEREYGLRYDGERYAVRYDAFASNVMPDISVSVRGNDP